jgi:hypothetical protein
MMPLRDSRVVVFEKMMLGLRQVPAVTNVTDGGHRVRVRHHQQMFLQNPKR